MSRTREDNASYDMTGDFSNDGDFLRDAASNGYDTPDEVEELLYNYTLLENAKAGFLFSLARHVITLSLEEG